MICLNPYIPLTVNIQTMVILLQIDYHGVKSSITVPIDPKMWHTTQLLMSERLDMRLTAGQLLHTSWIETAATASITQIFNWNN